MSAIIRPLAALLTLAAFWVAPPIVTFTTFTTPAAAQARVEISAEFRTALEPYGEFRQHARWGEVWVPAHVGRDWRPYTVGHWVYSDDYGWYWVSDESEAEWGWVTFHYGRWVLEREIGWVWVAGKEWGPAFVNWRRGREHIGWAPMPPEEIVVEVVEQPDYWILVRIRDFTAPKIATVVVPPTEAQVLIQQTVVENRTVIIRERNFAVNPGIAPAIVAAAIGRPIPTYQVRPVVFAGTADIPGATLVRADELRQRRDAIVRQAVTVQQTTNIVQPARNVPPPQPLARNENGRLGDNPPRAATDVTGTTGAAPAQAAPPAGQGQQRLPGAAPSTQQPGSAQQPGQPPAGTSGQAPSPPNLGTDQRRQGATPSNQAPSGTTGQGPSQQNLSPEQRRRGASPSNQPPGAQQRQGQQPTGTTGQGPSQQNLGPEQRRRGATPSNQPPGAQQRPDQQPGGTSGQGPSQQNLGAEQRRGATPSNQSPGAQQRPGQPPSGTTGQGTSDPSAEHRRGAGPSKQQPGAQRPGQPPSGTTGQGSQPNLGTEQRGGDTKQRGRTAPQTSPPERGQQPGTSGAAPSTREPSSGGDQRRGSEPAAQTPRPSTPGASPRGESQEERERR
jgi:hypothetical protein